MTEVSKVTVSHVRQILMNELGLTREYIRQQITLVVRETIEKKLNDLESFQNAVENIVSVKITGYQHSRAALTNMVTAAINKSIAEEVARKVELGLRFDIHASSEPRDTSGEGAFS